MDIFVLLIIVFECGLLVREYDNSNRLLSMPEGGQISGYLWIKLSQLGFKRQNDILDMRSNMGFKEPGVQ